MRSVIFRAWGVCVVGLITSVQAADWPGWRGPERSGLSRETGLYWQWGTNSLPVMWRASVGKGFSSFAIADGRAVTMGHADGADTVWCFDAEKGDVLWKHSYPCDPQPLSYEGGPSSTPALAGGRVYTFSKSGDLFCLNAKDGQVVWQKKFDLWPWREGDWKNTWRYAGSPLIIGDRLYMSLGQAGAAFRTSDGSIVWQSPAGHPGYASPVPFRAGASASLAFFSGHAAIGVDAVSGKRLWEVPWHTEWDMNAADPILQDGKLFVSSGNNAGCALYDLSVNPPGELWRNKNLKTPMNSAVLCQGCLYGFNDSELVCVAWATGEQMWSERSIRRGSLVVADGHLVTLSENGQLTVAPASPKAFAPILKAHVLAGRCWTAPALSQGLLYVRNAQGEAICLKARAQLR